MRGFQHVQNCSPCLVADAPRRVSSRPLLQQLHWLPVQARITCKLCTLVYRVCNGTAPQYLAELCQVCTDDRLQSASKAWFLCQPESQPKQHLDQLNRLHSSWQTLLYFTMGCPFPPQNCPFTEGDLDPYLTHGSLGPPSPHWYLNKFRHFCRVQDRNRQTDRPWYSIYNNRPHLRTQYYDAA